MIFNFCPAHKVFTIKWEPILDAKSDLEGIANTINSYIDEHKYENGILLIFYFDLDDAIITKVKAFLRSKIIGIATLDTEKDELILNVLIDKQSEANIGEVLKDFQPKNLKVL